MLCEKCENFTWHYRGNRYLLPFIGVKHVSSSQQRHTIKPIKDQQLLNGFDESFMIRTRLNRDLDYIVGDVKFPSVKSKKNWTEKYDLLKATVAPFGLTITRMSSESNLEKNDPFIIHRFDVNPFKHVFPEPITVNNVKQNKPELLQELRWDDWKKSRYHRELAGVEPF